MWCVRWDGKSNAAYVDFGIGVTAEGMDCSVVEWVKHGIPRWSGHDKNE